jgi:hypothetical protein
MLTQPDPQETPTYRSAVAAGVEHLTALEEARAELQGQLGETIERVDCREALAELADLVVERDRAQADAGVDVTTMRELQADAEWFEARAAVWRRETVERLELRASVRLAAVRNAYRGAKDLERLSGAELDDAILAHIPAEHRDDWIAFQAQQRRSDSDFQRVRAAISVDDGAPWSRGD